MYSDQQSFASKSYSKMYGVEPRCNDLRYNDIPSITINNRLPSKSYSKMYGAEPRYNDFRYNDTPGLTMGLLLSERKMFPVTDVRINFPANRGLSGGEKMRERRDLCRPPARILSSMRRRLMATNDILVT